MTPVDRLELDPDLRLDLLRALYRVRAFERAAERDVRPASLLVPTATALALADAPPDVLTIRAGAAGASLLRGLDARDLARRLAGDTASGSGRDASGHPTRHDLGLLGPVPIPGVSLSVAAGAALAFALRGERRVAVVVDDAAVIQSGGWHEGFSLAAARGVPLVAVLLHATAGAESRAGHRRAEAYGVHAERLAADDAEELARRIARVVRSARTDPATWLLEVTPPAGDPLARLEARVLGAEPEAARPEARERLERWDAEADAEAREAWRGLEVAA